MSDQVQGRQLVLGSKVPAVTASFWAIKVLSTTVGETGSDHLAVHAGLGAPVTDLLSLSLLAALQALQLAARTCVPWRYWGTVVMLSVVGTQLTDLLTDGLDVSLYASTACFAVALAIAFRFWLAVEGTLSIHSIVTTRRELFYWLVVLLTFALGTAAGDLATEALGLGFRTGVLVFGALIALVAVVRTLPQLVGLPRLGAVPAFWAAYVLTRPLGASLGDLLSQSRPNGGAGLGTSLTSLAFLAVIAALVAWISLRTIEAGPGRA